MMGRKWPGTLRLLAFSHIATAIQLDPDDPASIKNALKITASDMLEYYYGDEIGNVPGNLPDPYYWWEAGAMMMTLVDYHYYTGDTTHVNLTIEALQHQVGPDKNYMTDNQTMTTGNDDQGFWGMAAMGAAELRFPNPRDDQPSWLALAQGVYNSMEVRWDDEVCDGGLRWQVYPFNRGWDYKNTISNGCLFNIATRLYRYTHNTSYADTAIRSYDWLDRIGLVGPEWELFDGRHEAENCTGMDPTRWTYNLGIWLHGSAVMWAESQDEIWRTRVDGMLAGIGHFLKNGILHEERCEAMLGCDYDQRSFKAYLSRWLAMTAQLCPWTHDTIMTIIRTSAVAAASTCIGGDTGSMCGLRWTEGPVFDGFTGPGEQMAALSIIGGLMVDHGLEPPATMETGNSTSDPGAGLTHLFHPFTPDPPTTADRVGAGFLTAALCSFWIGGAMWIMWDAW